MGYPDTANTRLAQVVESVQFVIVCGYVKCWQNDDIGGCRTEYRDEKHKLYGVACIRYETLLKELGTDGLESITMFRVIDDNWDYAELLKGKTWT